MESKYLFVYGTLRKASDTDMYHFLAKHSKHLSEAYFQGKLFNVSWYPGVIESNDSADQVLGDVFELTDAEKAFPKLDEYEECSPSDPEPHEYVRKVCQVTLADGSKVDAWVYVFNHDVSDLIHIESGDFIAYLDGLTSET